MTAMSESQMFCTCPIGFTRQPHLRYLSLSEGAHWTLWRSSDYFYPEMIPEPDYSDSGEETAFEEENKLRHRRFPPDSRPALERLRDLTEVYVSNVSTSKKNNQTKKSAKKQVDSSSKSPPKQTSQVTTKNAPQTKKTAKSPPRSSAKPQAKSPTEDSKTATQSTVAKKSTKLPEGGDSKDEGAEQKKPAGAAKVKKATPAAKQASETKEPKAAVVAKSKATEIKKTAPTVTKPAETKGPGTTTPTKTKSPTGTTTGGRKTSPKRDASEQKKTVDLRTKASGDSVELVEEKTSTAGGKFPSAELSSDEDQLIKPKKPYVPTMEKQKLHKELKFSQKYGKLVPSKTELQLALERYTENKMRKELDAEEKSSLEKILEYQAKKIEMQENMDKYPAWVERLQKPPSTWPNPKTEEFYKVHARVVSNNMMTQCFLSDESDENSRQCCSSLSPKSTSPSDSDS